MYLQKVLYQCSHVRLDRELFFSKSYLEFLPTKVSHRKRPSTLMLDKKERLKRSSNVSTTPSTDSSKSSKTFEFLEDYDEETKEKVLSDELFYRNQRSWIAGAGRSHQRGGLLSWICKDIEDWGDVSILCQCHHHHHHLHIHHRHLQEFSRWIPLLIQARRWVETAAIVGNKQMSTIPSTTAGSRSQVRDQIQIIIITNISGDRLRLYSQTNNKIGLDQLDR